MEEANIDKFIRDYIDEVERTLSTPSWHIINKRSTDMDVYQLQGVDLLIGFREEFSLPVKFPNDLILFSNCPLGTKGNDHKWYAAALEASQNLPNVSPSNHLVLFKYQAGIWVEKHRVEVMEAVRLEAEQIGDMVYIMVAEQHEVAGRGSPVLYLIDNVTDTLKFEQMLDKHFVSDITMWKWEDMELFAAVAVSENERGSESRYSTLSPVYHWQGGSHWNLVDVLPTHNPRALAQFTIGSSMFIAVANYQNDLGETLVDSEIFRFDLASNKIRLYQKLPTEAALDIKYFCFQGSSMTEYFLVYASAFHIDEEGRKDFTAASIIYKMSDEGYFVPFQALRVPMISSWQPVRHIKDNRESLTLLAAMANGVASFQYDGWRFVSSGVNYDRTSFGPGPKVVNVFYHQHQTFISVANKESPGYQTNVFSLELRHDSGVEQVQQELVDWKQRVSDQMVTLRSKMASLLQVAQSAPSKQDKIVNLGPKVTFLNAVIDNLETSMTKEGEIDVDVEIGNQLFELNTKLEIIQHQLKTLKSKIDKTTFPELILYEDVDESEVVIECVYACRAEQLQVSEVNGETNFTHFQANTVNINDPVVFEDVTFEHLAVNDPLQARTLNSHSTESLVDWSKHVYLEHGLQVEGDIILKGNLTVGGKLDGVAINSVYRIEGDKAEKVMVLPNDYFKSLNTSQLQLSDSRISGEDFDHFRKSTLKTEGDQIFSEFQDFESIEASEVVARGGVLKAGVNIAPSPFLNTYEDSKPNKINEAVDENNILRSMSSRSDNNIEAINYIDNDLTITTDFTIYGSVTVQNGRLNAKDVVDLKHNISAKRLMEKGIPLDQPVVNNHFVFHSSFKPINLKVDSLNGLNITSHSLVDVDSQEPVVVTGRKEFRGGFTVNGNLEVSGTVNGVSVPDFMETLSEFSEIHFDNLTVQSINGSSVELDGSDWNNLVWKAEEGETVYLGNLSVERSLTVNNLHLQGVINNVNLEEILEDTVCNDGSIYKIAGKKHFTNNIKVSNLTVVESLNNVDVSRLTPELVWKKRLSQAKVIKVDNLVYTGYLDGVPASEFGEWMLEEGDQTVMGSQTIHSMSADYVDIHIVNSVDIKRLMAEAVYTFDNATLRLSIFEGDVESAGLVVGGRLRGLQVPEDLVLSDAAGVQQVSALKHMLGNLTIHGDLRPESNVSDFNVKGLCQLLSSNTTRVVVTGSASFKAEPNVSISINNKTWDELMENIWFKEEAVVIDNLAHIYLAEFDNLVVENINNNNVEECLSKRVSLSEDGTINGTLFFTTMNISEGLEAGEVRVGGLVQGLHLETFVKSVMLDGEDQDITGVPDFNHLIVDGELVTEGLVNSLNLSTDVMLNDVPNNTVTGSWTLNTLTARELNVPVGARVAGADMRLWNNTVVKKSGRGVVTGNIVFRGMFDSPRGIRVRGLVNGMTFDNNHVMLMNSPHQITGVKTFSDKSKLSVDKLDVEDFLNGINITDFYSHQVTRTGDAVILGAKNLSSPLTAKRAILPETFQGYNLSWLDHQLGVSLPWDQYHTQLEVLGDIRSQAELSLAGQAYYLKNISRVGDIKGMELSVFPLKNHNSTVLGVIRRVRDKTTMSLLNWNHEYNMFVETPESFVHVLRATPVDVQSVNMPGDEIAVYVTRYISNNTTQEAKYGEILQLTDFGIYQSKIIDGQPNSKLLSFRYFSNRTCFVIVADTCRVYCPMDGSRRIRLPSFPCQNVTEMSALTTQRAVYLTGLQNGLLVVWRLQGKKFAVIQSKLLFNPVSLTATVVHLRRPLIAVANIHRLGSAHPESIDLYSLNENTGEVSLEQELLATSPRQVMFTSLPTKESLLYVTSDNPAVPLEVFIYRGLLGYVPFTAESTLARPKGISTLTDHRQRHFVILQSEGAAQVMEAQFQQGGL